MRSTNQNLQIIAGSKGGMSDAQFLQYIADAVASASGSGSTPTVTYGFRAYLAAITVPANQAWTIVPLDTKSFDVGSNFSISTHLFTAPVTGYYQFDWGLECNSPAALFIASLYINGVEASRGSAIGVNATDRSISTGSDLMKLDAGDTAALFNYANGGGTFDNSSLGCRLAGVFVGK